MARTCILIPTYNNARTLPQVLNLSLKQGLPVLVVNDGSTDDTARVLASFPEVETVQLWPNQGKGYALLRGFEAACSRGFDRAITLDSDLQHDPREVPRFLRAAQENLDALIVGCRGMKKSGAPLRSRFGLAMSNLFFTLLSGRRLRDTQSGFRSYPLRLLRRLPLRPSRFEFEFEVLVMAARAGIPFREVPISVRYEKETYVTHFKPVRDFWRIFRAGLRWAV